MSKIRVAFVGDSPFLNSGFGVVAKAILNGLPLDEMELHGLGVMLNYMPADIHPFTTFQPVCVHDMMGFEATKDFLIRINPDVAFFIGDPGSLYARFQPYLLTGRKTTLPFVTYFPLEGAPFSPPIWQQAKKVECPVTYTEWGMNELANYDVIADYVWHGFDHADFQEYSPARKSVLRRLTDLEGKFVVGMVGVNKRTNRYPAVIETARILKDRGYEDFVFYLHTQVNPPHGMGGWDLSWMPDAYGVLDKILFKQNQAEHHLLSRPTESDSWEEMNLPLEQDEAMLNLSGLSFIDILNLFDVYLDPASAHGFNLPLGEVARCGVPGISVDDGYARTEIYGDVCYMIKPTAHDHWHTGAYLPLISPKAMADAIEHYMTNEDARKFDGAKVKAKFDAVTWKAAQAMFTRKIREAYEYGLLVRSKV